MLKGKKNNPLARISASTKPCAKTVLEALQIRIRSR